MINKNTHQSKQVKKITCNYCKKSKHILKKCRKWIAGGRSPKFQRSSNLERTGSFGKTSTNVVLLTLTLKYHPNVTTAMTGMWIKEKRITLPIVTSVQRNLNHFPQSTQSL